MSEITVFIMMLFRRFLVKEIRLESSFMPIRSVKKRCSRLRIKLALMKRSS